MALDLGPWPPPLRITRASPDDLDRYIDLLEHVSGWLAERGIDQWRPGNFRAATAYYAGSIARGEVQLAFCGDALVGTLRLLLRDPIVWPDITEDDAVYVYSLAVTREWAHRQLGPYLLEWAADRATALGRRYVRLDCMADNTFLRRYYSTAGFKDRGAIEADFPPPIGRLRLRRYERTVP